MSIVYSALLPHSPLLINPIGKDHTKILAPTLESYQEVIKQLKNRNVETIFIISPHGDKQTDKLSLNTSLQYEVNLSEFGDLSTRLEIEPDLSLAQKIKDNENLKDKIHISDQAILDYGSSIPLYLILSDLPGLKALSLTYSDQGLDENYEFGKVLANILKKSDKNIAIIASGDMSHCLQKNSPGGYSPKGTKFDNQIKEILTHGQDVDEKILNIDDNLIKKAGECGLRSLVVMLGILNDYSYEPKILSYQSDFGVGYLSAQFNNLKAK